MLSHLSSYSFTAVHTGQGPLKLYMAVAQQITKSLVKRQKVAAVVVSESVRADQSAEREDYI